MDSELLLIVLTQSALVCFFWPLFVRLSSRWRNKSLRRDNPHLNRCYYFRMWGAPLFFIVGSFAFLFFTANLTDHDLIDKILISGVLFFACMFTGVLITEFLVDRFKTHPSRTCQETVRKFKYS